MEFPFLPSNPLDKYQDFKDIFKDEKNNVNEHYFDMYLEICEGWLHCFRHPSEYLPTDKPIELISESDFINYKVIKPNKKITKKYDYIYSCPKLNENSSCDDWVSYNKNWTLAITCIEIMSKMGLKGLLIGRKNCKVPDNCETTGWVEYNEMLKLYQQSKFLFLPNIVDASPRVLTECLSLNIPCVVNYNILGGWKYINKKTGEFFNNEKDIKDVVNKLLMNIDNYEPRQYIKKHFGPLNSGIKLKKFIFNHFKNKVLNENGKVDEKDINYITIRHPIINY